MNRGDRREALFEDDRDRQRFLETLGEACGKTGWQVQAYCLMDHHFHLVLQTPQANLVAGMKWLLGTYTSRFNRRHKEFRHLFSGRYYGEIVHEAAEAQAQRLVKEGLRRMKWKEKDLQERRKGEAGKVRLACELRAKTTMPLAWIAERLKMGSRGYLTWLLYRHGKKTKPI